MKSPQLVKLVCQEGADLSVEAGASDDEFKFLARIPECLHTQGVTAGMLEKLAKARADINCADELGRTPLHYHAAHGHVDVVKVLIDNDAGLDQKDKEGKIPLHLASEAGAPEELLGVKVNWQFFYHKCVLCCRI